MFRLLRNSEEIQYFITIYMLYLIEPLLARGYYTAKYCKYIYTGTWHEYNEGDGRMNNKG